MNSGDPPPNQQPPPSRRQYRHGDNNNAGDPDPLTPKNHAKFDTQTTNKKKRQTPGGNSPENWKRIKPNEGPSDNALAEGMASIQRMASSQETPMNNDGSDPNVDGISESDNSTIDSASQDILDDNKKPSARKDTASVHDAKQVPSKYNTPANNGENRSDIIASKAPSIVIESSNEGENTKSVDASKPAVNRGKSDLDTSQAPSTKDKASTNQEATAKNVDPRKEVAAKSGIKNAPRMVAAKSTKENKSSNVNPSQVAAKSGIKNAPRMVAAESTKENKSSNVNPSQVPAKSGDVTSKMNNQDPFETQLPSTSSGATNRTVHTGHSTGQVSPTNSGTYTNHFNSESPAGPTASGATNPPVNNSSGSGSTTDLSILLRIVCQGDATAEAAHHQIWTFILLIRENKFTDSQIEAIAPPDVMMQVGRLVGGEHVTLAEAVLQFFSVIALRGKKELVQSVMNTLRETKDTHHILLKAITSNPPGDAAFYFISLLDQMAIHLKGQTPLLSNEEMKGKVCDILFPFLELGDSRSVHYATARCFHTLCNVTKSMPKLLMEKDVLSKLSFYVSDNDLDAKKLGLQLVGALCESRAIDVEASEPYFQELWLTILFQATKTPLDRQPPLCTEIVIDAISSLTYLFGTIGVPKNFPRHGDDALHITSLLGIASTNLEDPVFARLHTAAGKFAAIYYGHFSNADLVFSWTPLPHAKRH